MTRAKRTVNPAAKRLRSASSSSPKRTARQKQAAKKKRPSRVSSSVVSAVRPRAAAARKQKSGQLMPKRPRVSTAFPWVQVFPRYAPFSQDHTKYTNLINDINKKYLTNVPVVQLQAAIHKYILRRAHRDEHNGLRETTAVFNGLRAYEHFFNLPDPNIFKTCDSDRFFLLSLAFFSYQAKKLELIPSLIPSLDAYYLSRRDYETEGPRFRAVCAKITNNFADYAFFLRQLFDGKLDKFEDSFLEAALDAIPSKVQLVSDNVSQLVNFLFPEVPVVAFPTLKRTAAADFPPDAWERSAMLLQQELITLRPAAEATRAFVISKIGKSAPAEKTQALNMLASVHKKTGNLFAEQCEENPAPLSLGMFMLQRPEHMATVASQLASLCSQWDSDQRMSHPCAAAVVAVLAALRQYCAILTAVSTNGVDEVLGPKTLTALITKPVVDITLGESKRVRFPPADGDLRSVRYFNREDED